ncbi:MAG: DUF4350 domain-containing protein [Defluviitaleaceae bacterium]|nr:DUF4350 domain-containing protein [Defluviitaleaceae bacterium]
MRNKKWFMWFFPAILVLAAVGITYFLDTGDGTPHSVTSTGERGASLIFDTLQHMNYPARRSYRPLTPQTDPNVVYVIIQPRSPAINAERAEEMLEWVYYGGRLIFLCWNHPNTAIDRALDTQGIPSGQFTLYTHGSGAILTGDAVQIENSVLMHNHAPGRRIQITLDDWNSTREVSAIFFAEYYHGFHTPQNFVGRLPLFMRLILLQTVIFSLVALLFFGKRFGNSVPYYEEIEREENEYVRALARLYQRIRKK